MIGDSSEKKESKKIHHIYDTVIKNHVQCERPVYQLCIQRHSLKKLMYNFIKKTTQN